jgi:hypothetical protein
MLHELMTWLATGGALTAAAVLFQEDVQQPAAPIAIPTTTETLVLTSNDVTTPNPNGKAVVRATVEMTVGAGTTGITLTVYSGSQLGGRIVGQKIPDAGDFTPGNNATFQCEFIDPFSNTSDVQYCVSVTQTGATGNGNVLSALIDTKVLSG